MKKKLSILPIVVLALTMLFGTVSVWADPIPVNEVKITMPPFCEGKTAGGFLSEINVSVKIPDGAYTSEHLVPLEYHGTTNYNNFTRKSPLPEYDPRSTDKMINGKYLISLNVISASENYYSFDPNVVSITLNGSPIIPYSLTQTTTDVITVKFYYTYGATPQAASTEKEAVAIIDRDLFKSEAPSKTVIAANSIGANSFFDMKVHAADAQTQANQKLLAQNLVGAKKIFVTENIYPRRDLSISENGSLKDLNWNNLPKNQPGAISAVVYNQIDGAYVIHGILDANGTATFTGFKLRPASTITICK